ncbi:response regulator transcription factor [Methylobacterium persicinum]|nr:HTH-type transcriptional regulator MalT [Methylobacterium persicinum]
MRRVSTPRSTPWLGKSPIKGPPAIRTQPMPDLTPPTAREAELIVLIAQGLSNKIIAYELNISPNTVRSHISNIMRKYKLRNRTQVAILFMPQINVNRLTPLARPR